MLCWSTSKKSTLPKKCKCKPSSRHSWRCSASKCWLSRTDPTTSRLRARLPQPGALRTNLVVDRRALATPCRWCRISKALLVVELAHLPMEPLASATRLTETPWATLRKPLDRLETRTGQDNLISIHCRCNCSIIFRAREDLLPVLSLEDCLEARIKIMT